jgi:hypothetical protein
MVETSEEFRQKVIVIHLNFHLFLVVNMLCE